ncbi:MAG: RHS repeat-associated core domain-containing protein [Actinophytocola sp.]
MTAVVLASVVTAATPPLQVAAPAWGPAAHQDKVVPHRDFPLVHRATTNNHAAGAPPAVSWPAPGEATVELAAAAPGTPSKARRAGDLPVTVAASTGPKAVRVRLADRDLTRRAGGRGVLLSVALASGDSGVATVGVDYGAFRDAVGGDWGSRLRLVRLPGCALSTPEVPACRAQTPLPSRNDTAAHRVSASVPVSATETTTLALEAGPSGPQGTFEASSLAPSGTWAVSGNTGAFTWSYPIALPPAATGEAVAPQVTLGYNSSTVDGRTVGTNNQSSWIGQGWDYSPGYVERTYRPCSDDEGLPTAQQTGDLCWAGQVVTMSLGGRSVPLVLDDATQTWHAGDDGGARVELLTDAPNGAFHGEHWRVTTKDGVRYWFGRQRGPGWTDQEQTNSTWTVPVYGPRSGDPCNNPAGFAQSSCAQAWRWNLDFVDDPSGNVTAYYYAPETNFYGAGNGTTGVRYTRGGTLAHIDYGLRTVNGSIYGQTVPDQVVFTPVERCVADAAFSCDPALFTASNASRWPDTPQDQNCLERAVCNNHSPSFWSTKRLATITTQYNTGAGPVRVDSYQLTQSLPGSTDPKQLRLDSVVRTGFAADGSSIAMPPVEFVYQLLNNRVPGFNNQPAMLYWRMTEIDTDTGSAIQVRYQEPECAVGNMPTDAANNTRLCFPAYWTQPFQHDPTLDYFHKYVVDSVRVSDRNGVSPSQLTTYTYLGEPAWHFDDNEVVKPKHRTYGQFRGYAQVEVRTGDPHAGEAQTLVRSTYFRGMKADVLPNNGSRPGEVTNSLNETTQDDDRFAGQVHEVQTFNGASGTQLSTVVTDPVVVATPATRNRPGLRPLTAEVVGVARTRTITSLAAGGTRERSTTNRYDSLGRLVASTDSGTGVPDVCTTTRYAEGTALWIRGRVSETLTSQQVCPAEGVAPAPVLKGSRTYYDSSAALGVIPGAGLATRTDAATGNAGGVLAWSTTLTVGYDAAGRPTSSTDPLNNITRTAYTPTDGGTLSRIVTTNPKNQQAVVEVEPSRGATTATVDVGGRRTDATYDQLGRLTAVWKPGRAKGTQASVTYDYQLRRDRPLAVTKRTLVDYGTGTNYVTTTSLYDAMGQLRQTQTDDVSNPDAVAGRVVGDVFYDGHGWAVRSNNRYTTTGAPDTTLIAVGDEEVDDRTVTTYDGNGRPVVATAYRGLTPTWDTRTVYGGDRTTSIPPEGGVTSTTLTDVRDNNVELRQYTSSPTVTGSGVSGGAYTTTAYHTTPLGQVDQLTDAAGNTWSYHYDLLGRQDATIDPDAGTATSTYDLLGRLTSATDGRGQILSYEYDPLGRKTAEWSGAVGTGTKLATWTWDTAPNGVGLLASTARITTGGNYLVGFEYNGAGLVAKQTVRIPPSVTGLSGDHTTVYRHTTTGQVWGITPTSLGGLPGEDVNTTFDRYGNPSRTAGYNVYVNASQYTPFGEPAKYTLGVNNSTGSLTYDRDAQTRRVTGVNLSVQDEFPQVDDLRYTYDDAGNVTRTVNVQGSPDNNGPVRTECFAYDPLDRLTDAWTGTDGCAAAPSTTTVGGPTPYWTTWTFDTIGLRKTQTQHAIGGGSGSTTTYTYPPSGPDAVRPHSLTSTTTTGPAGTSTTGYTYNGSGDTTTRTLPAGNQSLTWTQNNRLETVTTPGGVTSYVYDADGNQLIRRDPGRTTLFLPGEEISRDTATGTVTGTRYYSHNGTTVALRIGGANISYLQSDLHGTLQVAVGAVPPANSDRTVSRRTFDPYGNPIGTGQGGWPDSHGFLDKSQSPDTGLTDVGARNYDPTTGRFLSADPVLDVTNPQQWHPYAYAGNNPATFADPSGLIYYLDDNNASIPNTSASADAIERADQRAKNNQKNNMLAKLNTPVSYKGHGKINSGGLNALKSHGYKGSNDFTYADAIEFAQQGDDEWEMVCQAMGGTSDECMSFNPFTGKQTQNGKFNDDLEVVGFIDLAAFAVAGCAVAPEACLAAIWGEVMCDFCGGGTATVPRAATVADDVAAAEATQLRTDHNFQFPGAGRSGSRVKDFVGPPNSVVRGASEGRVFVTDGQGRVILDITKDRAKPVIPGQGFPKGDIKTTPTAEQLGWIDDLWGS